MDLQEMKETYPQHVKAITDEARASVSGEVEGLKTKVSALEEENKKLSMQVAIQEEAGNKATAESIQKSVLAESSLPETLHAKVMKHVDFHTHLKDGKFDAEGFKTAFTADVKEWETGLSGSSSQGAGVSDSRVDTSAGDKVDMETINKVLSM